MTHATQPTASVLIIGNEILSGRTEEANIAVIARKLGTLGIDLKEVRIVPDETDAIVGALNSLRAAYSYVFTTGGIGPTHDDITMAALAAAFGVELIESPEALRGLEAYYTPAAMNPARRRMALVPSGAELIENPVTAAPGVRMGNVFVLAGVPEIMKIMLEAAAADLDRGPERHVATVRCALPESLVADELAQIAAQYPVLDIGSYPTFRGGSIGLALVVRGIEAQAVEAAAHAIASMVASYGGEPQVVVGY